MKRSPPPGRRTPLNPGSKGLAAGKPLARGKPLAGKATLQRGGPIPQVSDKRKTENTERRKLGVPARCEIRDIIRGSFPEFAKCYGPVAWHERRKRSAGGSITNPANCLGACSFHNDLLEIRVDVARAFGNRLVVREGDDGYEALGARKSRLNRSP